MSVSKPIICADCGFIGAARRPKRGSALLERFIWLVFFLPGPLYSYWRRNGVRACPKCGSKNLIPFETPEGDAALRKHLADKGK